MKRLALACVAAALLGSCGGGGGEDPGTSTPQPNSTPTNTSGVAGVTTTRPGATTVTATTTARPGTYTVEAGDTLWAIAQEFGITVEALAEANGITDPGSLAVGQELNIPAAAN